MSTNSTDPKGIDTFQISHKTLVIGAIITVGVTIIFMLIAQSIELKYEVRDIIAILTFGIVSTTLIYHAMNLKLNYEVNKKKLEFDKEKQIQDIKLKVEDIERQERYRKEELERLRIQRDEENKLNSRKIETDAKRQKVRYSYEMTAYWCRPDMAENVELSRQFLLGNKDALSNGPIQSVKDKINSDLATRRALASVLNYFEHISLLIKDDIVDEDTIKGCFKTLFVDYHKVLKRYIDEIQIKSSRYLMNFEEIAKKWEKS